MRLSTAAFAAMTAELRRVADECCRGRIVAVTEGGYDLPALRASIEAALEALSSAPDADAPWVPSGVQSTRGQVSAEAVAHALRGHWNL